jgi:hypothetical protein
MKKRIIKLKTVQGIVRMMVKGIEKKDEERDWSGGRERDLREGRGRDLRERHEQG